MILCPDRINKVSGDVLGFFFFFFNSMTHSEPRKADRTHDIPVFLESLPVLLGNKTGPCVVMHIKGMSFYLHSWFSFS